MCARGCQGEGGERAAREEACVSRRSDFLWVSGSPRPPISVSLGSQLPLFTSPPVQAVVLISSSPLIGFLLMDLEVSNNEDGLIPSVESVISACTALLLLLPGECWE